MSLLSCKEKSEDKITFKFSLHLSYAGINKLLLTICSWIGDIFIRKKISSCIHHHRSTHSYLTYLLWILLRYFFLLHYLSLYTLRQTAGVCDVFVYTWYVCAQFFVLPERQKLQDGQKSCGIQTNWPAIENHPRRLYVNPIVRLGHSDEMKGKPLRLKESQEAQGKFEKNWQ